MSDKTNLKPGDHVQINELGESHMGAPYVAGTKAVVYELGVGANEGKAVLQLPALHLVVWLEYIDLEESDAPSS